MVRVSNGLIAILNGVTLAISLVVIGCSIWFSAHTGTLCQKVIQKPLLIIGLFILVVSLLGLIGSSFKRFQFLLYIYLVVMLLLIIGLFAFTVFTIIVTNKGVGKVVSERGYKEYRLGDYSSWLQKYVINGKNWDEIKSCLNDAHVCGDLTDNQLAADFYKRHLSAVQSGCCKPPTYCGFEYHNATFWTAPKTGAPAAVDDSDCKTWSNDQQLLCFDCKSCKAGVLSNIKRQWRLLAIFNSITLIIIITIYSVGCCAARNNSADSFKRLRKGHP